MRRMAIAQRRNLFYSLSESPFRQCVRPSTEIGERRVTRVVSVECFVVLYPAAKDAVLEVSSIPQSYLLAPFGARKKPAKIGL